MVTDCYEKSKGKAKVQPAWKEKPRGRFGPRSRFDPKKRGFKNCIAKITQKELDRSIKLMIPIDLQ